MLLLCRLKNRVVVVGMNELLNPLDHLGIADVHVLHPYGPAVDRVQVSYYVSQRSGSGQVHFDRGLKHTV